MAQVGDRYGRLVVVSWQGRNKQRNALWLCRCDCGSRPKIVRESKLHNGNTTSCGCFARERSAEVHTKHGHSRDGDAHGTPTYQSWRSMIDRCTLPSHTHYDRYGGRGIRVCKRWQGARGFENFLADMGERPEDMTLDRRNNDGDYKPSNCQWSTHQEQHRNKSSNVLLTFQGKTQCLSAWEEETGIGQTTLRARLDRGLSDEEALTQDVGRWAGHSPKTSPTKACSNCGGSKAPFRHGRCNACGGYFYRTGRERPITQGAA